MSEMRRWGIITAVAVLVIFAAGWLLLIKPQKSKVTDLKAQTAAQQQQNALLLTQISSLQAEQKELPQQQQRLQKFSTQVPNDPAEPTLIRQFSAMAHGSGVDMSTITPGGATPLSSSASGAGTLGASTTPAGTLFELPLSITVSGSYPNLESFFAAVEKLPRAVLNTGFSLAPGAAAADGTTRELTATLNLDVFYSPAAPTATASQPQALTPATSPTSPTTTATTPAAGSAGGTLPPGTTVPAASN